MEAREATLWDLRYPRPQKQRQDFGKPHDTTAPRQSQLYRSTTLLHGTNVMPQSHLCPSTWYIVMLWSVLKMRRGHRLSLATVLHNCGYGNVEWKCCTMCSFLARQFSCVMLCTPHNIGSARCQLLPISRRMLWYHVAPAVCCDTM